MLLNSWSGLHCYPHGKELQFRPLCYFWLQLSCICLSFSLRQSAQVLGKWHLLDHRTGLHHCKPNVIRRLKNLNGAVSSISPFLLISQWFLGYFMNFSNGYAVIDLVWNWYVFLNLNGFFSVLYVFLTLIRFVTKYVIYANQFLSSFLSPWHWTLLLLYSSPYCLETKLQSPNHIHAMPPMSVMRLTLHISPIHQNKIFKGILLFSLIYNWIWRSSLVQ